MVTLCVPENGWQFRFVVNLIGQRKAALPRRQGGQGAVPFRRT